MLLPCYALLPLFAQSLCNITVCQLFTCICLVGILFVPLPSYLDCLKMSAVDNLVIVKRNLIEQRRRQATTDGTANCQCAAFGSSTQCCFVYFHIFTCILFPLFIFCVLKFSFYSPFGFRWVFLWHCALPLSLLLNLKEASNWYIKSKFHLFILI